MNKLVFYFAFAAVFVGAHAATTCKDDLVSTYAASITSSSQLAPNDKSNNYGPDRVVLNNHQTTDNNGVTQMGAWVAEKSNFNQYINVELKDAALIRGVITQGRDGCCQQWVNKYRILYSEDCKTWHTLGGFNVTDMFFTGNTDEITPVMNMFDCPVIAKCIRINPLGWNNDIAMRVGFLGCPLGSPTSATTTSAPTPAPTTTKAPTTTQASTTQVPTTQAPTTQAPITTQKPTTVPKVPTKPASTTKPKVTQKLTTKILIPTQATTTPVNYGTKGTCIKTCQGKPNGDYQSCKGCDHYITCVWDSMYGDRPCPAGLVWDDNEKRCLLTSSTCP